MTPHLKYWGERPNITISDEGGWLPGIYECRATALCAYKSLDYDAMLYLSEKICRVDTLNRAITTDDLNDFALGNPNIIS